MGAAVLSRATLSWLCTCSIALVVVMCGANFDLARAALSSEQSDRPRCGAVRILISLAQPSRDFWRVRSPSLWCGANFDIACTALSWLLACQIPLVVARCEFWHRLRSPLMTFGVSEQSDRPCCGFVRILISFAQPSRDFWRVRSLSLWRGANFDIARALVWLNLVQVLIRRSCEDPADILEEGWMIFRRSLREDLAEIVMKSFLQGPCMIPCRSLIEDLVEILVRSLGRFLYQDLVTSCNIPSSSSVFFFFKWRSCEILLGVLAWSSWSGFYNSLWEDLVEICRDPDEILWEVLAVHDLVKVLVRRWWNPERGPCMILHRFLWEDLVEILLNSSSRGPCIILQMSASVLVCEFGLPIGSSCIKIF